MTSALDEIRSVKFRMAKRSGYEVLDVDAFLDRIEQQVMALEDEIRRLRADVNRLQGPRPV